MEINKPDFNKKNIECFRQVLNKTVEKYGVTSSYTLKISQMVDELVIRELLRREQA